MAKDVVMMKGERKRLFFTVVAVVVLGIVTGLFLGGDLLPSQTKDQLYDEVTTQTTTKKIISQSHDDIPQHEHTITTTVTITETTPHGYFHDLAAMAASGVNQATGPAQSTPKRKANEIWIMNREFLPNAPTVPVGTTITWNNRDDEEHTVTFDDGSFNRRLEVRDATASYTFTSPGTFEYHCDPHKEMTGKVIVR